MSISKKELCELSERRLNEALVLLQNGCFSGAYYLAGYAVELSLKAIVASTFLPDVIPDKKWVDNIYTHNLDRLRDIAGLRTAFEQASNNSRQFLQNWTIISIWNEQARYKSFSEEDARILISALTDSADGVMPWRKNYL